MYQKIPILIPAYNPDKRLLELVDLLVDAGVKNIIIVNDGSKFGCKEIFNYLENLDCCTVLQHAVNLGKGRALKTGFNHIALTYPDTAGVVTADCDGQHSFVDIRRVTDALIKNPSNIILGARTLHQNVPFRSRFGNQITRLVFFLLTGRKISDTQTGLRGIPGSIIPELIITDGERYEFEINLLIRTTRTRSLDMIEIPIDTIYFENNKSSHFNPLLDSIKIYFQLLRYTFSSLLTCFVDFIVFSLVHSLTANLMISLLSARFFAGTFVNYIINRTFVFRSQTRVLVSLLKYYFVLFFMSIISLLLINQAQQLGLSTITAKILVETGLFCITFLIQREFVFYGPSEKRI